MSLSGFERFTWATAFVGQVLLLLVLFVRRRARLFPLFTALIAEEAAANIIKYVVFFSLSAHVYRYCYWSIGVIDEILQIFVFWEVAVHVFCPVGVWARDVRRTLIGVVLVSAGVAFLLSWFALPVTSQPIQTLILRSNFFSAALMSELFVGMVVLSGTVGLPWKTHVARIAQGLGIYSLVCVGLDIIANFVGLSHEIGSFAKLSHLQDLTYLGCESYWIVMLWVQAAGTSPASRKNANADLHLAKTSRE